MASPPFTINEAVPEDDDIVSQFPSVERTYRDVVESWLLVNHNVNGRHDEIAFDFKADPSAPGASINEVWASSTGNAAGILKTRSGASGTVEYVGTPPGVVFFTAAATIPEGYLVCQGQAISRTTYARLFDTISTTYGVGDGSTTFNVPDIAGRVIAGKESSASRLTAAGSGINGGTLGAAGGTQTHPLITGELAVHTHGVTDPGHLHGLNQNMAGFFSGGAAGTAGTLGATGIPPTDIAFTGITVNNAGSGTAHQNTQPTIVLNAIIKT